MNVFQLSRLSLYYEPHDGKRGKKKKKKSPQATLLILFPSPMNKMRVKGDDSSFFSQFHKKMALSTFPLLGGVH